MSHAPDSTEQVTAGQVPNLPARSMFAAIAAVGVLQLMTIVVQVVRTKAISVVLGPVGLGMVGLLDQLIAMVATLGALSLPTVVLRILSRAHGKPEFGRLYAAFLKAVVIASVVFSGVLGIALTIRPTAFGDLAARYSTEFGLALANVPLFAVALLLPNVLAATMRPIGAAWLSFGLTAVAAIGAGVGLALGGIRDIYLLQAVASGALLAAALVYFKRVLHLPIYDRSASLLNEIAARPDIVPTGIAVYAAVVGSAFSQLVVRYVTVHSLGGELGGWLQAILSMVLAVGAVLVSMAARYLSPVLNRPSSVKEKFALFDAFRHRQLMMLIALAVPLVLFAKIALLLLFSSHFMGAATWLPAFVIWQLLVIQTNVQLQLLFALDELWVVTAKSIAGSVLSAILCVTLIPPYGLGGAAVAMIAGTVLTLAIGALRLRRHGYAMAASSVWLGGYAAAVLLAAPLVMQSLGWDSIPLRAMGCVVLIGGLWPFLSSEEKSALARFGRKTAVGRLAG